MHKIPPETTYSNNRKRQPKEVLDLNTNIKVYLIYEVYLKRGDVVARGN